jgi:adenylate cyclase
MRGALVVAFDPSALDRDATLLMASETSLEHVMLSGLGRIVQGFLDDVAATGAVSSLTVHDAEGRLYHDAFGKPIPPPMVGQVLATGVGALESASIAHPEFLLAEPLANEKACQTCHGPDRPLRGAIEVRLDTSAATTEINSLRHRSEIYALATISFVILLLWGVLHVTVIAPVGKIGLVAELVGAGRFDAKVDVSSHDEIGRLGARMNMMVEGLRQKVALSRFVSRATVHSVEQQGTGGVSRGGTRRRMTVLFSDIRGFTAFSETHEPEQVVDMLNQYLHAQAGIVAKHGGDIDKFVGDELMARFDGPDMERRAIRCAVEMAAAVAALSRADGAYAIRIGVGVNSGEMVFGAMGSEERMDFTVIGDAVNLGARLCAAAQASQVLVAGPVREAASGMADVEFVALDPIKVKGKQEPVAVYSVVAATAGAAPT